MAPPPACPIIHASSTAAAPSIHALMVTADPLFKMTTLRGCAAVTAWISATWCAVRSRSARSYPSDSLKVGSAM